MNTPVDPRTGDRRQKALRARLQAMAGNNASARALLGKLGQSRGRVQAAGSRGTGARIAQNGAARPGALNFLPVGGFGLDRRTAGGPALNPVSRGDVVRHAPNALPARSLEGPPIIAAPYDTEAAVAVHGTDENLLPGPANPITGGQDMGIPNGLFPVAGNSTFGPSFGVDYGGAQTSALPNGLVPLGGGRYYDPATGTFHGAGGNFGHQAV